MRLRLKSTRDPGTGKALGETRVINSDGTFNVTKVGAAFSTTDIYHWLVSIKWSWFLLMILGAYVLLTMLFAFGYLLIGIETLSNVQPQGWPQDFYPALFFSAQTFTTVGYGAMAPSSHAASVLASFEAFVGLLSCAVFTGLLYGRFARPTAHFRFSKNALISPYEGGKALMFRLANERSNLIMNIKAKLLLVILEDNGKGGRVRQYYELTLETDKVYFFPLNWTIVHPIDENSPLSGMSTHDLEQGKAEILVQVSGYDETFSQEVIVRYSYLFSEFVWDAKFQQAYHVGDDGTVIFDLDKLNEHDRV